MSERRRGSRGVALTNIVTGQDEAVAAWAFRTWGCQPFHINMAIGLANDDGELVGAFAFSGYNGSDAEIHVLAPGLLNRRTVRLIFGLALRQLNLNRLTVRTRKPSMARGVLKLGAKYECRVLRLYGPSDADYDSGQQFVFFRETIEKLAGVRDGPHQQRDSGRTLGHASV